MPAPCTSWQYSRGGIFSSTNGKSCFSVLNLSSRRTPHLIPMCRLHSSVFFLMLWLTGWLGAVEITAGPTIDVKGTAATVNWSTDVECGTLFKYGLDADHLNHSATGAVGKQHAVSITGLIDGKTYFYSAGTAKKSIKSGQFGVGKVLVTPIVIPVPPPVPAISKTTPAAVIRPAPEKKSGGPSCGLHASGPPNLGRLCFLAGSF